MRIQLTSRYKYSALAILVLSALASNSYAEDDYTFDDSFIKGTHSKIDLSQYMSAKLAEGTYSLDVYLNDKWKGRHDVEVKRSPSGKISVYYTAEQLTSFGILAKKLNNKLFDKADSYAPLSEWSNDPHVLESIDKGNLRVNITVPQIYDAYRNDNYIDPSLWDKGIPALNLRWNGNVINTKNKGYSSADNTTGYLGINASASVGGWVLKHQGNVHWDNKEGAEWTSNSTYLERPIPAINTLASVGQISSTGEFFDTVSLRGMSLKSDMSMYPDSMSLFKPEVRGTVSTNATVTVQQNGKVVYETTVPPGDFVLTDYYPSSYNGDLYVTIKEANGATSSYTIPYNTGAVLLYPGVFKYELVTGKFDGKGYYDNPVVYQGTAEYGFNNIFTGYAGISGFNSDSSYQSYLLGLGVSTQLGAFSFDVTNAKNSTPQGDYNGNMYRATYSRRLTTTDTTLSVSGTRYSSEDYYGLNSALSANGRPDSTKYSRKSSLSVSANQKLPDGWGSFYANGRFTEYWDRGGYDKQYQVSYSNNIGSAYYNLSVQKVYNTVKNGPDKADTRVGINVSVPFDLGRNHSVTARANTVFNNTHYAHTNMSINGTYGEYRQFNYGVTGNTGDSKNVALNAGYRTPYGVINSSYSQGGDYRSAALSGNGSVVAHSGGVILTPESGDTLIIAEAKGGKGAKLASTLGSTIDSNGYAITSSAQPYRVNSVQIDPKGSSDNIYFNETKKYVSPYRGSVVKVTFDTEVQDNLMVTGKLGNGKPFPFGASVYNEKGAVIGAVGQGGTAFITDTSLSKAKITWKEGSCSFTLPKENNQEVTCQ